jgi:histidinol-phosphate aminotransferase
MSGAAKRRVERAIILAAGRGSRLDRGDALPKPLRPVAGVPLIGRILRTLASEGIREAVVVVGYEGDRIQAALTDEALHAGVTVHFVENSLWERSNGLSLLAAREYLDRECLLTMADHLVAPALLRRLMRAEIPAGACALGVDFDIERCFDLDDATKVLVEAGRIGAISKELDAFNAIDTGIFRVNRALVEALDEVFSRSGDASLSEGVRALAATGRFVAVDVGDARWIDVDTPEAQARAEAMLRVFGDGLDDADGDHVPGHPIEPEAMEMFAPSWVRGASPYREDHFALADQEARNGNDEFARLMSNESPFPPSARVIEAVVKALSRGHRYPNASMARELRSRLAGSVGLDAESCVLGAGSSEVIDLLVRAFVAPGEEVVIAVPTFSMYEARTRLAGGIPVLVPMRDDLEIDASAVMRAVTERTKLLFLCSPNNPTGRRLDENTLRRVLRPGIPVVVDEAYVEFSAENHSVASMIAANPNLIIARTFSKAYGLAGLRVGYALACPPVARLLNRVKLPWNVSTVALAAALAVLDDAAEFDRQRALLREERDVLRRELGSLPGVSVFDGDGNFLLLDIHDTGWSAEALVQSMLTDGVFIRALASHHLRRGWVRVSVGAPDANRRCIDSMRRSLTRGRSRPALH